MGFFDKLFKKDEKGAAPAAPVEKKEPVSTKASFKAEPAAAPAAEAPKACPCSCSDKKVDETVGLQAADLGELLPGAPKNGKIKLANLLGRSLWWSDVSLLDTHERILTIGDMATSSCAHRIRRKREGHRGNERWRHHRLHHLRSRQELRERAHGQTSEEEVQDRRVLRKPAHASVEAPHLPTWSPVEQRRSWTTSTPRPPLPPASRPSTTPTNP